MNPNLVRKFKTLGLICLFTSFAGVLYQLIDEERLDYNSVMVGFPLGLFFGLLEMFIFPNAETLFRRWSFTTILVVKTVLYTVVIYMITIALLIVYGLSEGREFSELPGALASLHQAVLVIYTLVIYGLLVFFLQINHLLGEGVLWKFIRGKYHRPREEERIFMFLDMKSSTTIAEKLGHVRFYKLLNEVFHEISQPVLQTRAEIYQYIGDEVVLTWKVAHGLENSNCLKAFFLFKERLQRNSEYYLRDFGINPEFKAGLHFGKVISAQIGDLKREIVYNGDVLNTTSRIQNECNKYQRDCLVSGLLRSQLDQMNGFHWEKLDTVILRGKESEVELFSVMAS
ncbi:adenylate/guanylate cyclase domain-containing protein [Rufibacter roseolus]|uniref:adenylate/guanylate cyclase domain-containing protein n=1 Tax=Rufibacter roseolus TaxID=2817375 RepID=UPI001B30921F|nr:adenylate/guanylate cyclase domain-containing protein [Rufibacter roseolus]